LALRDPHNALGYLDTIFKAATRASEILKDPATKPAFDLNKVASETADALRARLAAKRIKLRLDLEIGPPLQIYGESIDMYRALINLCLNAIDSTAEGGELMISTGCADENAIASVRDNGKGMSEETLSRLWDRNVSADGKHGHGLAVVREKIDRLKGVISVESKEMIGTTFKIELPLAEL
jgi:two-component system phosphate regulon sensor histidine kinase PhoR